MTERGFAPQGLHKQQAQKRHVNQMLFAKRLVQHSVQHAVLFHNLVHAQKAHEKVHGIRRTIGKQIPHLRRQKQHGKKRPVFLPVLQRNARHNTEGHRREKTHPDNGICEKLSDFRSQEIEHRPFAVSGGSVDGIGIDDGRIPHIRRHEM